ncbi:MAG: nuclear transport factor 2 family protein [Saprospirales bacterium]|nr:nuclear transport factor 2 family protein [Saprospirales bacterium]
MRNIACLLILIFGGSGWMPAQSGAEKKSSKPELNRFDAMVRRDTAKLRAMLDDGLYYVHSNGLIESKRQHISAISAGSLIYMSIDRGPQATVRRYRKIALVNGQVRVSGVLQGGPFSVTLNYTAVYRKRKQQWLLLNWQSTRVQSE